MKHTVTNKTQVVERTDTWQAEINGYDAFITQDRHGFTEISIAPTSYEKPRLPLLTFYPENVSDLEALSEALPSVLDKLSKEMRKHGLIDLRDKFKISMDSLAERIKNEGKQK